jgi:hypothetical protein
MTRTKSTTKHYKHSVYYTLESLYPTNATESIDMDMRRDPDSGVPDFIRNEYKWMMGNRSIFNAIGRARKAKEYNITKFLKKRYKWQKRFNWTYLEIPLNKSTYGRKPNFYLLYKSLLGGWKHNDLQQFWNVRLPGDGLL